MTPRPSKALHSPKKTARFLQQEHIGPEHLLFGLMANPTAWPGRYCEVRAGIDESGGTRFASRLNQLKFVERIVRPVRAGTARNAGRCQELLAHLSAVYDEELDRLRNPDAALRTAWAIRRAGGADVRVGEFAPGFSANRLFFGADCWAGGARLRRSIFGRDGRRHLLDAGSRRCHFTVGIVGSIGWDGGARLAIRPLIAFLVLAPVDVYLIGWLQFKLRDTIFGVFGSRKSRRTDFSGILIAVVVALSGTTFVAIAEWDWSRPSSSWSRFWSPDLVLQSPRA